MERKMAIMNLEKFIDNFYGELTIKNSLVYFEGECVAVFVDNKAYYPKTQNVKMNEKQMINL